MKKPGAYGRVTNRHGIGSNNERDLNLAAARPSAGPQRPATLSRLSVCVAAVGPAKARAALGERRLQLARKHEKALGHRLAFDISQKFFHCLIGIF